MVVIRRETAAVLDKKKSVHIITILRPMHRITDMTKYRLARSSQVRPPIP